LTAPARCSRAGGVTLASTIRWKRN
jgi:hypothetical protein